MMNPGRRVFYWLALVLLSCCSVLTATRAAGEGLALRQWTVDGVSREALVQVPKGAKTEPCPVVFVFHGHGGTMQQAARSFGIHTRWPEAIVVYMQGLNTPGTLTDPEGKRPGWQEGPGSQNDRDLKFFDAVLASLQQDYAVNTNRIYATGHSNGGRFSYVLWASRGDKFAAFGPSSSPSFGLHTRLKPKPVLHVAGEKDQLVKFAWQEQTIKELRLLNQCGPGEPVKGQPGCTLYPSKLGAPVFTLIHPGGHAFPSSAPDALVNFFRQHTLSH